MDYRMYKKVVCPVCGGNGRVHGWDCKRCGTVGEVSIPVEEILAKRKAYYQANRERISEQRKAKYRAKKAEKEA